MSTVLWLTYVVLVGLTYSPSPCNIAFITFTSLASPEMDTESATYLIQTEIMSHISPGDTLLIPVVKVALTARMALILSRA